MQTNTHQGAAPATSWSPTPAALDPAKIERFLGMVVTDGGAAFGTVLAAIGDRLGLYRAMAGAGPLTPAQLAERTGTRERYVREWLMQQAAGGYVTYDPAGGTYSLPPEHAVALTDETAPFYVGGVFQIANALFKAEARIGDDFRVGHGMGWGEHDHALFEGTERFFRAGYLGNLVGSWIPALDGVKEKLEKGARVADVGCGHGASTIILAQAFPRSRFFGFDAHAPSIERARQAAADAGVDDRVVFEVARATDFPGGNYDLVGFFDCFHDLGDPIGAARRAYETLAPDGTVMIVEPMAGEKVEDNLNPVGRFYAGASVLCCTPHALSEGGPALGTVASDSVLRATVTAGGFSRFRRATQTPLNRVFEARQ
jgi:SAM-dependent methyltransferase